MNKEIRLETELEEIKYLESKIFNLEQENEKIKLTIPDNWIRKNEDFNIILKE